MPRSAGPRRASFLVYPQIFGKYVLERELSRGGMARVVLATLRGAGGFEKKLVVKQIRDELAYDQQFIRRFVEEAKTTVALSHPNIVPVYELGVEQGTYFLAMELVEGVSVAELVREREADGSRRVLSPEEGAYVGVEVCRALDYAHRRMKVVHRDITPRNVMIDEEGQIKLIDFGIAAPALVAGHEILGSPGHMPPEQVDGGELGPPTDIFAVAVLLMEAWTGTAPFRRATPEECAAAVRDEHPRPSDFDPRLVPIDDAIVRAMDVDPKNRQQEASELARSLRTFLQGVDVADIARALGDRVRDLREEVESLAPPSRATAPRTSSASHGEIGTKTFAAREEALRWSNAPPSASLPRAALEADEDGIPVPSTRKLEDSTPKLPSMRPGPSTKPPPDLSLPTPLMVDLDALEKIHGEIASKRFDPTPTPTPTPTPGAEPKQIDVPTVRRARLPRPLDATADAAAASLTETSASRAFERPVDESSAMPLRGNRRAAVIGFGGLAVVVAIGGILAWRARGDEPTRYVTLPSTAPAPSPVASAEPGAIASVASAAPPVTAPSPASAAPLVSAPFVAQAAPAAPVAVGERAQVTLQGDPGTRVSIDGVARGACPVRLALDGGRHEVRFTFDPTGESRGESFNVKAGERVTVRASFTGASPTVKIQR